MLDDIPNKKAKKIKRIDTSDDEIHLSLEYNEGTY
jgi:hypothetical protein